ncbi:hypothetical protein KUV65_13895 [Maritalea mobilis]|uniref:hypothetical protein n=1 Tax=Maritalea mobilis TaxID=483324 RepID=UPI001C951BEC|nr:hypothetical protein [Maritalea mobilis]MBY6202465.1 hypothetical protein [Maritalea mobilis]
MPRKLKELVTVSPPTFDRCSFQRVDRMLAAPHAPYDRDWLMARFAEGLEIRMVRPPLKGFVMFQPGRLSWRPIEGGARAVVVHDLRVAPGPDAAEAVRRLWAGVEGFATYYGYAAVLAVTGRDEGLISPDLAPGRGWMTLDETARNARLWGRVLHGPWPLARLPRDWQTRAALLGAGPVLQTTGESMALEARATRLIEAAAARGIVLRHDKLMDPESARHRAVYPAAVFSVLRDGVRIGGAEMPDAAILAALGGA